jgi:hypothetical protein
MSGLYLDYLEKRLGGLNLPVFRHIIPAGEEYKNMETFPGFMIRWRKTDSEGMI